MRIVSLGLLLFAFAGSAAVAQSSAPPFQLDERLAAGQTVEIENVNGPITVRAGSGDRLAVTALRTADGSDPNSVQIHVERDSRGILICTIYPQDGGADQTCRHNGGSDYHDHDSGPNDTRVAFSVQLPASVAATLRTVNGTIDVSNVASPIDAASVNGDVTISTSAYAQAKTVRGHIRVSMQSPVWPAGGLEFASVDGGIDVTVPRSASAQVYAKTLNGSISSSVPLYGRRRNMLILNSADGVIGSGKSRLTIKTLNGSIHLNQSP
jgi:hypothetical protein